MKEGEQPERKDHVREPVPPPPPRDLGREERKSLQIADHLTDPGAREAIEQALAALRERDKREAAQRAANQGARSDAAALVRPLLAIVRADPDAERVFARLGAEDGLGGLRSSGRMGSSPAADAPTTANLRDDLSRVPPYNNPSDKVWNTGNDRQHGADLSTGYIGVFGSSSSIGMGTGDSVAADCGIGVAVKPDRVGPFRVRIEVKYTWAYALVAYGAFSSANAKGGIEFSLWKGGKLIDAVFRSVLYDNSVSTAGSPTGKGEGVIALTDMEFDFLVAVPDWYAVLVGAWVECDHSSGLGGSRGQGQTEGTVSRVLIEFAPRGFIDFTYVLDNPENIPPRPGTQLRITLSQFFGRGQSGIPILRNPITFPPIPFTTGFASTQIPVGDTSVQYWIDYDVLPGNGGNIYLGDWNDTYDETVIIPNPISFTNGATTTTVTLRGSLDVHQRPP